MYSRDELLHIAALAKKHNCIVVADEVYEWMVFPPAEMIRFGKRELLQNLLFTFSYSNSARYVGAHDHRR